MQIKKRIFIGMTVVSLIVSFSTSNTMIFGEFELGEIEDLDEWFVSSTIANISKDFKTNLLFSFVNESIGLEITPYLSLKSEVNVPFNFTGYLSKSIADDKSVYGIQIGSSMGNISISVNGSISLKTSITDPILITIDEGSAVSIANFETLIGENITVPINFTPIVMSVVVTGLDGVTSASLSIQPYAYLNGTIGLSSTINGQELEWTTGDEIYFNDIPITKDLNNFNISIEDILVNFDKVHLITDGINFILTLNTLYGSISEDFYINLEDVDWGDTQESLDFFILFLLDNILDLDDQEIIIIIDRASFPWISIIPILAISTIFISRRRK